VGSIFSITVVFPIIAAIMAFTAVRYIARDEALVRSVHSLRKSQKKKRK
jgi:phosphate/sulfate permease